MAGTSLFFIYALLRITLIRNSPQRTDTRTRAKKEKGRNALSRFIRVLARKGDALFVSSRGRKEREREREFNSQEDKNSCKNISRLLTGGNFDGFVFPQREREH